MVDQPGESKKSNLKVLIASSLGVLVLVFIGGFVVFSSVCPCERTPGGLLFGERAAEPVSDWSFANEIQLCQIQLWAGIRPHSINLNCMATPEGQLYLSCSVCDTKYWAAQVESNEPARLRLNGIVYPIVLNRVQNPMEMDQAWEARKMKLNTLESPGSPPPPLDAIRGERWWTFRVESAS